MAAKFIQCGCSAHGLLVDWWVDRGGSEMVIVPFGSKEYFSMPSLLDRIRNAAKTLKRGYDSGGEVILSVKDADELRSHINKFIEEAINQPT